MRIDIVTVFPQMIAALASGGVVARAIERGLLTLEAWNPRDHADNAYGAVDDRPYGGGPGMVMMAAPLAKALHAARARQSGRFRVIHLTPRGGRLTQAEVNRLAGLDGLVLLAGRYEGVDERLVELEVDEEWSLGDYVISGGELAAMVLADAVMRQRPGVLGHGESARQDSFMTGLLDCPHYTRPSEYRGARVPEVLLGGNHEAIRRWRLKQSLVRTLEKRPDLFRARRLNDEEKKMIAEHLDEKQSRKPEARPAQPAQPADKDNA
ncbi:MAG: tRNA (guanosine(37)-N1)-methyltransferase TrmD [Gammaproteobacteria bacterium]|nr:tRNA (guanosine(37)-N1)-methyltransferase TrmD [Gammaproteobacteria bacterium]